MSETIKDGGPAFQISSPSGTPEYMPMRDGMSLRDYFAAAALTGLNAACTNTMEWPDPYRISEAAYAQADAMLKARDTTSMGSTTTIESHTGFRFPPPPPEVKP